MSTVRHRIQVSAALADWLRGGVYLMVGAIDQGVASVQAGFKRMDKSADKIVRHGAEGDLAGQAIETVRAREEVGAGLAVVRALDEMTGCLLDELA
jgi:hypothetical protein